MGGIVAGEPDTVDGIMVRGSYAHTRNEEDVCGAVGPLSRVIGGRVDIIRERWNR